MSFENALLFFIAIFIFAITPGPGIFAILARAMVQGAWSCAPLSLGMVISDVVYLILACFGLAEIAQNWSGVFTAVRIIGALYLLYLGIKMWREVPKLKIEIPAIKKQGHLLGLTQGFLISASNPKVILFYIAFLPSFIDLKTLSTNDIILVSLLTLFALMLGLMLVAISASWAKQKLKSERAMKNLNRTAGSIMIGAAAYIGFRN